MDLERSANLVAMIQGLDGQTTMIGSNSPLMGLDVKTRVGETTRGCQAESLGVCVEAVEGVNTLSKDANKDGTFVLCIGQCRSFRKFGTLFERYV